MTGSGSNSQEEFQTCWEGAQICQEVAQNKSGTVLK